MTCVVATVDMHGNILMGADSSAVDESIHTEHIHPKVFKRGEFGIGYCHSFRLGQIVEFWFEPPPIPDNEKNIMRYMVMDFVPELKKILEDNDYPTHDEEKTDWSLIVGVAGKIFIIESDWHVGHDNLEYAAIGAGSAYALGAMSATSDRGYHVTAQAGLEVAEEFCPYVIGPFHFIEVKNERAGL